MLTFNYQSIVSLFTWDSIFSRLVLLISTLVLLIFGFKMIYSELRNLNTFGGLPIKVFIFSGSKKSEKINEELMALLQVTIILISAGETPINSLKLAADRAEGLIPTSLKRAFANKLNSSEIVRVLKILSKDFKSSSLNRMALSIQNALDRGTPVIEVLQNQIRSMQSKNQAQLMKIAGRRELILLLPVVFILMPISIAFVVWPSIYQLQTFGF